MIDEGLRESDFHKAVIKECGPIIENLGSKYYPDKNGSELSQILLKDYLVSGLISGFEAMKGYKKLKNNMIWGSDKNNAK